MRFSLFVSSSLLAFAADTLGLDLPTVAPTPWPDLTGTNLTYCRACPGDVGTLASGCCAGEEEYLGYCYETCDSLTNGTYPFRSASHTCCNYGDTSDGLTAIFNPVLCINPQNTLTDFSKFGLSIDGEAFVPVCGVEDSDCGCPITNSDGCCPDEELFLGLCYKQCALLTDGTHPTRCWPWSCAVEGGSCFNPDDMLTDGFIASGYSVSTTGGFAKVPCFTTIVYGGSFGMRGMVGILFAGILHSVRGVDCV